MALQPLLWVSHPNAPLETFLKPPHNSPSSQLIRLELPRFNTGAPLGLANSFPKQFQWT